MTELLKCPICNNYFNPSYLDQVIEHIHSGIKIDQVIKGERVMIKANELRIGNWVLYKGHAALVMALYKNNEIEFEISTTMITTEINMDPLPLPLTIEILEKCGFKLSSDFYGKKLYHGYIAIMFENDTMLIEDDHGDSINIKAPTCLHQLQNLYFALTGEELEITL